MDEYRELTGDDIPYHLRMDAAALAVCDQCGRSTWDVNLIDTVDSMPQPTGAACGGRFQPQFSR